MIKSGPLKIAPHVKQGYYIRAEDLGDFANRLHKASWTLRSMNHLIESVWLQDLAEELALCRELPSAEEATIKAQMDLSSKVVAYPDGAELEARDNTALLKLAGLTHG